MNSTYLSIIIPCFNENKTILKVVNQIKAIKEIKKQIILVDDGSNDGTRQLIKKKLKNKFDKVVFHKVNKGKGAAIISSIRYIKGNLVIIQDADLEYNPKDYAKLIKPFLNHNTKVVYGSRVLPGATRTRPKTFDFKIRIIANLFLTFLSNLFNKQGLSDCHTCYKVFSSDVLKKIKLYENGFNFCPEITAKVSRLGIKIKEVPIDYYGRTHAQGKKIVFLDGIKAIYSIFKYNLFKNT